MQLGGCWGADFSGTFVKLSRIFRKISLAISSRRHNICKHLHSLSELQVVASLSGLSEETPPQERTYANLIALRGCFLTTSERLFYIKLLTHV